MRQQCGLAVDRRRQIAADQAQVRALFRGIFGGGVAGEQGIHPRAAALVLARKPVAVEQSQRRAGGGIPDRVALDGRVPRRNAGFFLDSNAEDASENLKHSIHDILEREVRAKRLFVEVIQRGALFFRPIADIPGL